MILVCEPVRWGLEHVPFNAALLTTMRLAFPHDTIYFYGEESHLEHVRIQTGTELAAGISWRTLVLPHRHSRFFNRLPSDLKTVRGLLNELNKDAKGQLMLSSAHPSLLWAIKLLIGSVHRDKNVQVVLHGELASLAGWRSRNLFMRIQDLRTALKIFNDRRIQYIVLEKPIQEAVIQELPFLYDRIGVLEHPIAPDEGPKETGNFNLPIQFGFLGLATEQKGFFKYLKVASEISTQFCGLAEFHVIGRLHNDYKDLHIPEIAFLSTKPGTERLSRNEYVRSLNKLHFVCLFCEGRHYHFSASGVLLDSIAWEKPIIAPQLPIFRHLEHRFGDIGYLCKNDEFSKTIATIIKKADPIRYKRQILNIRHVKGSRTPQSLAKKCRELCERFKTI